MTPKSDYSASPVIRFVKTLGVFISQVHDTEETIYQWKSLTANDSSNGGTILYFYRTATTTGGLSAKSWTAITNGSDIVSATSDTCVQFKAELFPADDGRVPYVDSVTINFLVGSAGSVQPEQLIHSAVWNNRYWISAAELGESANNLILVRGKRTFDYPWQLKRGVGILSFLQFGQNLYGGSSGSDGKIYRLDAGYSLAGSAFDSFWESADIVADDPDLVKKLLEVIVDYELMGDDADYDLSFGISIDRGTTWTETAIPLVGTGRRTKAIYSTYMSRQFRFRARTNGIDMPWLLHGIDMIYRPTLFR